VLDHKKAVQQLERHRGHSEEVECDDDFAMILQERQPALGRVAATPHASQIPRHTPLRHDEADFLKLSVDLRGSPTLVLLRQSSDQEANLLGDLWSAGPRPGSPATKETETGAVPADHGVGPHQDQDIRPAGPTLAECCPEESVQGVQFWPRPFPFQHGDLLSEGKDFEGGIASTAKEDSDGDKDGEDNFEHEALF
jgi:hypothetical protein